MARYQCKGSVTGDRVYKTGDFIELTDKQAAQLMECGAVEAVPAAPEPEKKQPEPSKSSK